MGELKNDPEPSQKQMLTCREIYKSFENRLIVKCIKKEVYRLTSDVQVTADASSLARLIAIYESLSIFQLRIYQFKNLHHRSISKLLQESNPGIYLKIKSMKD